MNKAIIILTTFLINIPLFATSTRISVCNNLKNMSWLPGGEIGVWVNKTWPCERHKNAHLAQGSCDSWLIGGCNTEVEVWFPNRWAVTFSTSLVYGQYEISAEQQARPNFKTDQSDWVYVAIVKHTDTSGKWKTDSYVAQKR